MCMDTLCCVIFTSRRRTSRFARGAIRAEGRCGFLSMPYYTTLHYTKLYCLIYHIYLSLYIYICIYIYI